MKTLASPPVPSGAGSRKMADHPANNHSRADAASLPIARAAQIIIIVLGSVTLAYFARSVLLPILLAWVAAMTLKPLVVWLGFYRVPRALAAATVLGLFLCLAGFGVMWLGRPAVAWAKSAPETLPQLRQKFQKVVQPVLRFSEAAARAGSLDITGASTNSVPSVAVKDNHMFGTMFDWTSSLVAGIGEAVVLTFLLLAAGDTFMQKLAHVLRGRHEKRRAIEIGQEMQSSVSTYLFTVTLINTGLGLCVGTALYLLGMPNAAMWGGVAALLNFLPFFGPIVGVVMVGLAGLLAFDSIGQALLPVGIYLALHLTESYFVTPYALGQRFRLSPVVIFIAFILFAWLWGPFGALLAVPLLVSLKVICERLPSLLPLVEFLSP